MDEIKYRILQVHNYYQVAGGEDTVVANEKKLLEDSDCKVIQYCRHNSEFKEFSCFRKLLLPFTTIFNPRTYWEIKRIIKNEKIDIVHVHNTLNLISPAVYYASLKCKTPVVQTIHNFRLLCPGATFYRDQHICEECVKYSLHRAIKHNCYRESKMQTLICVINTWFHRMTRVYGKINYICLTEFNKTKLLQLKQIKPDRVFVKPNFVHEVDSLVVPYNHRKEQFIYAGRLDELKGIKILLEAWNIMGKKAPKLLICGTGPMEDWCRDYIIQNKLNSVEMKGFVSNNETRTLIAQSKGLLLPTQWYEGFPMTIVEAYSVGTPVMGSDIGNTGDLIENGVNGWKFDCTSSKSIMKVFNKVFEFSFDSQTIQNIYRERYSQEKSREIVFQVYGSIKYNKEREEDEYS